MKYSVCPARMVSGQANDFKFTGQQLDVAGARGGFAYRDRW
jgi:hypothetical protein